MTIESVERFITQDGSEHKTQEAAEKHVVDKVCEALEKALNPLLKGDFPIMYRSNQLAIINHLVGDYGKAANLIHKLNEAFEYISDDID